MSSRPDYPAIIPYLAADDASKAIEFYKAAFGAEELFRLVDKSNGKVGHAELTIRGQIFMIADEYPGMNSSPKTLGGTSCQFALMVDDTDAAYERALAAGATGLRPPADQFYGHRMAVISDPAGHQWTLQQELEKVSPEEMQNRWDNMVTECSEKKEA